MIAVLEPSGQGFGNIVRTIDPAIAGRIIDILSTPDLYVQTRAIQGAVKKHEHEVLDALNIEW